MKFTKKTRLLLAFVLSVTVASSSLMGIPVKADVNVKTSAQSQTYKEASLKYVQGTLQNTKYGKVQGYQENEGKTLIWKGVPYAKSPVGELRWKSPVDPEVWENTLDATKDGKMGIQLANGKIAGSEDCLNLDIYRPNTNQTNLPVLLFIHGGNNKQVQVLKLVRKN